MAEAGGSTGMISPQQLAVQAQQAKLELQAQADFIRVSSEEMVAAASNRDSFIPGTQETAETLLVKQNAKLETQRKAQKIAEATDFDNLSVVLGQDLASMAYKQRQLTSKIVEDSSVSLFDDPILALQNAFTLPWDEQALAGITKKIDVTSKAMGAINSHVQQSAQTAAAVEASITAGSIESTSAAVENLFRQKSAVARIDAAKQNSDMIQKVLQMDGLAADAYIKNQTILDQADARSLRHQQFDRQMKIFDLQLKKETDIENAEAIRLGLINRALMKEGKNPLTVERFQLYKSTAADLLAELTKKGLQLEINGPENYNHGATIEDRFGWQRAINWKPDQNKPQQLTLMSWQLEAQQGSAATGIKDKKMISQNADKIFNDKFNQQQTEIAEGSPFKAPAWKVYVTNMPQIATDPIWQKYITPLLAADKTMAAKSVDEGIILQAATSAVLAKDVTSSQAAAFITQVFSQSVALNNSVLDIEKLTGRRQTKYGVRLQTGFGFGKNSYDLVDPVQVTQALSRELVRKLFLDRAQFSTPETNMQLEQLRAGNLSDELITTPAPRDLIAEQTARYIETANRRNAGSVE